ncbi:N-acyl-phosphatidylethanolamine-hydrolyzing phospholipase D [Dichomitus squalens]|uniref:N-acyl-phosphatidylethanolamine-hydrolyzing phospholipase D n=1 Tax=Dichomitus squalens TaxID=114155 RepID=A0A4Q9PPU2_9APHY|nr:N-acyl-phosphatidylethanolamine-hydrolyzing phospholipase D [Dichomitus squalens]
MTTAPGQPRKDSHGNSGVARTRTGDIVVEKRKEAKWTDAPPAHHANRSATYFRNPWPSFRFLPPSRWLKAFLAAPWTVPKIPPDLSAQIPSQVPDWGAGSAPDSVKATWLGHACFLVELPTPEGAVRGPRILFDPVLSHRCSPFTWAGPERLLPTPCLAEDLPEVDAVVISHNHYDHMDAATLKTAWARSQPHFFAPLGNMPHFAALGILPSHVHLLDWWEEAAVSVTLPTNPSSLPPQQREKSAGVHASFVLTCTPAQHTAGRTAFDRWHTLWASWAVSEDPLTPLEGREPKQVYFAGDTGYRTVLVGEDEGEVPRCPAFKEIGEKFGGFDLALLPIGAYAPRDMWSGLHASPGDAVLMFKDVRARRGVGMHWGTWTLTSEPIMEPPELLKASVAEAGLAPDALTVCALGETTVV